MMLSLPALAAAEGTDYPARARELVARMTLEEKASLTSGRDYWSTKPIPRLGIPSIHMTDGPHGLRKAAGADFTESVPATCFPTASSLASTWNPDLIREVGTALGEECQANDVQILLGPGVNMKRSPLGGRNFEYFSEDPLLAGRMAAVFIEGVQGQGVGTSLKHFAANNQEFERMANDSMVDERTLHEIYLPAFETAVKEAQPWTVMCSYNSVNGIPASQNAFLLDEILRKSWGFRGAVVSDWGAVDDRVAGIKAGLHLEMPSSLGRTDAEIVAAVKDGRLDPKRLDEVVADLLAGILRAHECRRPGSTYDPAAHHALARRVDGEAIVLLKNDGVLPLDLGTTRRIAVIGAFATTPRYQGAGSSQVRPTRLDCALDELKKLGEAGASITYAPGYRPDGSTDDALIAEAGRAAAAADVAVVFAGLPPSYESEGFDRADIDLPPGHNRLIAAVTGVQERTVVVLMNGAAVTMPWAARVPGIIEAWLGGQAGGGAVADVLVGKVNPSGKLSETFPARIEDTPAYFDFPGLDGEARYGEGVLVGYRYYDTRKVAPAFPFGFGLSYTTFAYEQITADATRCDDQAGTRVHVKIRNTGSRAGAEVVQLYVHERTPRVRRPERELRAFAKVELLPGEERTVSFPLGRRDFATWDVRIHDWAVQTGTFDVLVGGSSRDLPLALPLVVRATAGATNVAWAPLTRNSLVKAFADRPSGKAAYDEILRVALGAFNIGDGGQSAAKTGGAAEQKRAMVSTFIREMPAWKVVGISRGALTEERLAELIRDATANH